MAACLTKDRDSGVSTLSAAQTSDSSSTNSFKAKAKTSPNKNHCSNNKTRKDPKNKESEISLDSLKESDLEALLKEAVNYRGPKDSQSATELFQNLLREASDSRDDSPPAFHYPAVAPQKRRRSRKESGCVFPANQPSSSVAGSNRRGGSLQNISVNSQTDFASWRGRKRHDTSGGGATPASPRKREGGSLPCDVARRTKDKVNEQMSTDEQKHTTKDTVKETVIDMEGVEADYSAQTNNHSAESSDTSNTDIDKYNSSTCTAVEDMDIDSDPKSKFPEETKRLFSTSSDSSNYGTIKTSDTVDSPIHFGILQRNPPIITNGTNDENSAAQLRRFPPKRASDSSDINGNPLTNGLTTFTPGTRTTLNYPILYTPSLPYTTTTPANSNQVSNLIARGKAKRAKAKASGILSNELPGFRGDQPVNELLQYIESSDGGGKNGESKKSTLKNDTSTPKSKTKDRSRQTKSKSAEALEQPDYDNNDSDNNDLSPGIRDPETPVRQKEQESADFPEVEDTEFQTVTKRQRRKKQLLINGSSSPATRRQQLRRSAGSGSASAAGAKQVASVPPSEHSDVEDSDDGGDSVHSLPIQHSAPLFPPSAASTTRGDARSDFPPLASGTSPPPADAAFPPLLEPSDTCAHFLSSTSLIYPTSYADIARLVRSSNAPHDADAAAAGDNQLATHALRASGTATLKRAASLPAADAPPVVIVGEPGRGDEVDVTFGFELNQQLLQPPSEVEGEAELHLRQPFGMEEAELNNWRPITGGEVVELDQRRPMASEIDFSARYREVPEAVNPRTVTQSSKEVIGFISEAWQRIEKKLQEQAEHQGKPLVRRYSLGKDWDPDGERLHRQQQKRPL